MYTILFNVPNVFVISGSDATGWPKLTQKAFKLKAKIS